MNFEYYENKEITSELFNELLEDYKQSDKDNDRLIVENTDIECKYYDLQEENKQLKQEKEQLMKYLEIKFNEFEKHYEQALLSGVQESINYFKGSAKTYQEILERLKDGKYE